MMFAYIHKIPVKDKQVQQLALLPSSSFGYVLKQEFCGTFWMFSSFWGAAVDPSNGKQKRDKSISRSGDQSKEL